MTESIEIGPVPYEENCQQVGMPSYDAVAARAECSRYIALIRQCFGPEPEGARLVISSNSHDFGTYYEAAVKFDDAFPLAVAYAFAVEADAPATWDDTRKREWQKVEA